MADVPTYRLYGEDEPKPAELWAHAESIPARSQKHDWLIKPHRHEDLFQILHLRKGCCQLLRPDAPVLVEAPAAIITPPGHEHGFRFSPDVDGAVLTALAPQFPACRTAATGDWLTTPAVVTLIEAGEDGDFLARTLLRIESEILNGRAMSIPLIEGLLSVALTLLQRIGGGRPDGDANRDAARIARLERLINERFRSHQPVAAYARAIGVSLTHLNRIASQRVGRPVSQLIADRVVVEAKRELVMTTRSIGEIAASLGFEDQAYFSRFFSRQTGQSPRDYRQTASQSFT